MFLKYIHSKISNINKTTPNTIPLFLSTVPLIFLSLNLVNDFANSGNIIIPFTGTKANIINSFPVC